MPRKSRKSDEPSTSTGVRRKRAISPSSGSEKSDDEFRPIQSNETTSIAELNLLSNNMVKYLLNNSATKVPIKRADLGKNLNVTQKIFQEVFKSCKKKLNENYGLEVSEIQESKSSKVFILHSKFKSTVTALQIPTDQLNDTTLLFIILSYIFMKGGEVQESHIFQFLEKINIIETETHAVFGDVAKLIRETFARQLYLKRTKVEIEGVNEVQMHVKWGVRAEKEFDKKEVLKVVGEIMNKSPATFINQYHEAHGEEPMNTQAITIE